MQYIKIPKIFKREKKIISSGNLTFPTFSDNYNGKYICQDKKAFLQHPFESLSLIPSWNIIL